jgi:hypothetical protein
MSDLNISINQHGNPVNHNASTPVANYNQLRAELEQKVDIQEQSPLHRSLDRNRIYYISDGTRSRYGVVEHLTWVSEDNIIGEKISDEHLERVCRSYKSRTVNFRNNRGGKRKTRKTRRSRK